MFKWLGAAVLFSLLLTFVIVGPALADPIPGDPSLQPIDPADPNAYLSLTQGLDVYYYGDDFSMKDWLASLPDYSGDLLYASWDPTTIAKKDFKAQSKELGRSVAALYKDLLSKDEDPRFKCWKQAELSVPVTVYNLDDTVFGYLYGLVYKGKLVGQIVAGACTKAPPILEYSLDAGRYLALAAEGKVYFSKAVGFVVRQAGEVQDALTGTSICTADDTELAEVSEPTVAEQVAVDNEWAKAATMASSGEADLDGTDTTVVAAVAGPGPFDAPNAETTGGLGTKVWLSMDTSDIGTRNICWSTSATMFIDALARRKEPGLFSPSQYSPIHPHSIVINDWYFGHYNNVDWDGDGQVTNKDISWYLSDYLNSSSHKLQSNMSFARFYYDPADGYSAATVFAQHRSKIDSGWPDQVAYAISSGSHAMCGVGYTTGGYYIVRDTFVLEGRPFAAFLYTWSGYTYLIYGATYSSSSASSTWGTVTLQLGSNNIEVNRLERFLKALYYFSGTPDNVFDSTTKAAVQAFQSDNGLTADGIVGSNTYAKMKVAHIMRFDNRTASWRTLQSGKKGDDVAQLQYRLLVNPQHFYSGSIDGIFGSGTQSAVQAFQQYMNVHYGGYGGVPLAVDGIAGVNTMKALVYTHFADG
jgi:peptidoglycan hydrolase-like protein with peptidoglycan-binding domain